MSSTKFMFFGPIGKKMAALSSDWLRHFLLFLWNRWTEFNKTWQEARSQCFLPSLCFSGRWVNKNFRPGRSVKKVAHCNQVHDMWPLTLLFPIKYWQHNAFCDFCLHLYSSRPLMPYTFFAIYLHGIWLSMHSFDAILALFKRLPKIITFWPLNQLCQPLYTTQNPILEQFSHYF